MKPIDERRITAAARRTSGPGKVAGMIRPLALFGAAAAIGGASVAVSGREPGAPPQHVVFATGAAAIDAAEYEALPQVPTYRAFTPTGVDLADDFPRPGNQGQQASCVAWATTYASSSYFHGERVGRRPDQPGDLMSPAFLYNSVRKPGTSCNTPLRLVDALRFLQSTGAVSLADYPTDVQQCGGAAPGGFAGKAADARLGGFRAVGRQAWPGFAQAPLNIDDVKGALYQEKPVVFIMSAPQDFMDLRDGRTYQHLQPSTVNRHAMALVGYDDGKQAFRVMNSWDSWWGDNGYAWVGYDTFRTLATEAYVLDPPRRATPAMRPPAVSPQAAFDALVAGAPARCGLVTATRTGSRLRVAGFSGDAGQVAALRTAALRLDPRAQVTVEHHPFPQCEAELKLARVTPKSQVRVAATDASGKRSGTGVVTMHADDRFGVTASVPADYPYLSLIYVDAGGNATELYRGQPVGGRTRTVTVGAGGPTQVGFKVGPPFGDEMIVALASKAPLFGDELKDYATERMFLSGLGARMARLPAGQAQATVLRLRTIG